MELKQIWLLAFLATSCSTWASVTLSFSMETVSGLANSAGVPSNDLYYGVIVDSGGNGIKGYYQHVTSTLDSVFILNDGITAAPTDDVLITAKFRTFDAGGGAGGIFDVGPFDFLAGLAGGAAISSGDSFHLIWFAGGPDGFLAGTLSDASFTIPADGALQDYTAPFVGEDPVRWTGRSYSGTTAQSTGFGIQFGIPEPSAVLLGGVGALGLLRRRRN